MTRMTPEQIQAYRNGAHTRAKANGRIEKLEHALADARCDTAVLTRLVVRMGRAIMSGTRLDFTIAGQREYDAAMHEAEGPPPDAGMLEAVQ